MNSWRFSVHACPTAVKNRIAAHPLGLGQLDLAHERVQVPDQRAHDLLEARVLASREPLDHRLGQGLFAELPHLASPAVSTGSGPQDDARPPWL